MTFYCTSGVQTGKKEAAGKATADLVWCATGDQLGAIPPWELKCGEAEQKEVVSLMGDGHRHCHGSGGFGNKPPDGMVANQRVAVQGFNCR